MKKILAALMVLVCGLWAESLEKVPRMDNGSSLFSRGATSKEIYLKIIPVDPSGTPVPTPGGGSPSSPSYTSMPAGVYLNINPSLAAGAGQFVTPSVGTSGSAPNFVYTSPTGVASYVWLSNPAAVVLTTAYSQNITTALAVNSSCAFFFSALGPSAGFYYDFSNSATPPAVYGSYYACSTTPILLKGNAPGTFLHLTVTGAALTVTVKVKYGALQ